MKIVSNKLLNLLITADKLCMMELFTITLTNGTQIRYTSGDYSINVGGRTFTPMTIDSGECKQSIGLSVDEIDVTLYYNDEDTIPGGATIAKAVRSGAFDYAVVVTEQVFMESWQFVVEADYAIIINVGRLNITSTGRTKAETKVKSFTDLLNIQLPRNVYQAGCVNTLYDEACTVNRAAFAVNSTALDGSTDSLIICDLGQAAGYFDQGSIKWMSGENVNVETTVKSYVPGKIVPMWPFPYPPKPGDTFIAYPGCSRIMSICNGKYNNLKHYKGTPFIPVPESVT